MIRHSNVRYGRTAGSNASVKIDAFFIAVFPVTCNVDTRPGRRRAEFLASVSSEFDVDFGHGSKTGTGSEPIARKCGENVFSVRCLSPFLNHADF